MRPSTIAGVILLVAGIATLILGGTFSRKENLLEVGGLKVTTETRQQISPWVAGGAILAGVVLLVGGARQGGRSRS